MVRRVHTRHLVLAPSAAPYIPFKSNSVGHQGHHKYDPLWNHLWHYYTFNRDTYMDHYHKRSNVETTFSMVKAKFGSAVRSKSHEAQVNEVIAKFVCHNICVLIQSMYEMGIKPDFRLESAPAA